MDDNNTGKEQSKRPDQYKVTASLDNKNSHDNENSKRPDQYKTINESNVSKQSKETSGWVIFGWVLFWIIVIPVVFVGLIFGACLLG